MIILFPVVLMFSMCDITVKTITFLVCDRFHLILTNLNACISIIFIYLLLLSCRLEVEQHLKVKISLFSPFFFGECHQVMKSQTM